MLRLMILLPAILMLSAFSENKQETVIDSRMTFAEAIAGTKAPQDVIDSLCLVDVGYYSTDGKLHSGQIVVNKAVREDIEAIFKLILDTKFPVAKVVPITAYNWSDDASMEDNNSSAFCYRNIAGTKRLSKHSFGKAVDINPFFNPVVYKDGSTAPAKAHYDKNRSGAFSANHPVVLEFKKRGWRWGGEFEQYKDNHHFDKE
jgi:peptidoglycan LD-endopeptidase CwlK